MAKVRSFIEVRRNSPRWYLAGCTRKNERRRSSLVLRVLSTWPIWNT